ncbi:Uncharacterized protein TCM_018828 [Theobroma cacao]|uniref:Uncharacterized protein n=1 Tax=Theobroma cacao TaxID=3641 RepID=A0A061EFQ3_THECC|nr:Uncharacterized protein TCM_018828 [Theobroma cacao]
MRVDREGGLFSLALFVMLMLFEANSCRAAEMLMEKSNTTFSCSGRLNDCLIAEDMELELLMDSHISRMLIGANGKATIDFTNVAHKTVPCGPGKQYGPCINPKQKKFRTIAVHITAIARRNNAAKKLKSSLYTACMSDIHTVLPCLSVINQFAFLS